MDSRRLQKVAETYRHEISHILLTQVSDDALFGLTVTQVRITPDMRLARVYFALSGGKEGQDLAIKALRKHKGELKKELAARVPLKYTPDLQFFYDETDDLSRNVESLFQQLDAERSKQEPTE